MREKKFCYFGTLIAFVAGIVCSVLVLANGYDSPVRHFFEPITNTLGIGGFVLSAGMILPVVMFCAEYYFNHKKDFDRRKRNEAILRREEATRKAEEARKATEANAELWEKRWESHIKPFLKFALGACALFAVVCIVIGGASAFISSFGMVAFLLLVIILLRLL